jgi:ComEC/Rec2-related protein
MKIERAVDISKFGIVVPALFFAGYFLPSTVSLSIGALILFLTIFDAVSKKRVLVLFSVFLLFSGNAINKRDSEDRKSVYAPNIKTPLLIENRREILNSAILNSSNRELLKALSIGERDFSEKFRDSLIVTGTMHLVAISAFHTGIMIMLINFIFRIIFSLITVKYKTMTAVTIIIKISVSIYYFYLTGASIPTLRALVFILTYDTVYASGRKPAAISLYLFSLTGVSVIIPGSAVSLSFVMSALCVATVLNIWDKLPRSMTIRILTVSVMINYVLIPVSTGLTGGCSLFSPFVNLLVIPLVSLAVPLISLAQFSVLVSTGFPTLFIRGADIILTPAVFHINYWSEISTMLTMPLIETSFTIKVLFAGSFFIALSSKWFLKPFFILLNLFTLSFFISSFTEKGIRIATPFSLYGNAKCVVFEDSFGHIYFDPFRNTPGATVRFYHRMERAASECGINRVISITSKQRFQPETIEKLKKRYRFRNTVFKEYHRDLSFTPPTQINCHKNFNDANM